MPVPMFLFLFCLALITTAAHPEPVGYAAAVLITVKLWREW
jgi:hypothetical protein